MILRVLALACGLCCFGLTSVIADVLKAEVSELEVHLLYAVHIYRGYTFISACAIRAAACLHFQVCFPPTVLVKLCLCLLTFLKSWGFHVLKARITNNCIVIYYCDTPVTFTPYNFINFSCFFPLKAATVHVYFLLFKQPDIFFQELPNLYFSIQGEKAMSQNFSAVSGRDPAMQWLCTMWKSQLSCFVLRRRRKKRGGGTVVILRGRGLMVFICLHRQHRWEAGEAGHDAQRCQQPGNTKDECSFLLKNLFCHQISKIIEFKHRGWL